MNEKYYHGIFFILFLSNNNEPSIKSVFHLIFSVFALKYPKWNTENQEVRKEKIIGFLHF